jgi:glucokinase
MSGVNVLAVDLGGSHAECAVIQNNAITATQTVAVSGRSGLGGLLPVIRDSLLGLLVTAGIKPSNCSAFVLGFPGIVSAREKRILATNDKFDDGPELDLENWSRTELGLPFLIENDARLALLGEYRCGAAQGVCDAVMITLGTGIGGAALLDGKLLQSKHGLAGTIGGHLPVVLQGRLCSCGNRGCAEAEAATTFLRSIYSEQPGGEAGVLATADQFGFAELFQAADGGDRPAMATLERCLAVWSALTVALIHAYDPEVVVFGGSILKRQAQILPILRDYVRKHAWTPGRVVPLRASVLGSQAALYGALELAESGL